jgi:hypothetical protein
MALTRGKGRHLTPILESAVKRIKANSPGVNPYAAATATLQKAGDLKRGSNKPTAKGKMRGAKSRAWRHAHPA